MAKYFHESQSPSEDLARTTLLITGITIISRLLGFGRDVLIAYILGGGAAADAFVAVFRIPNFVRRLVAEGCVSMPFIPEYFRRRNTPDAGKDSAMSFARSAMLWTIILTAPLCVLGIIFPEQALVLVAPGFVTRPYDLDAAATLLRLLLPYTLILCTLGIGGSILQARGRFIAPAVTPLIPNITVLAIMIAAIWIGHIQLEPLATGQPAKAAVVFCWALLFSGLLQWLYVANSIKREQTHWFGTVLFKTAWPFVKKLPLSLCGTATHQANILIAGMGASFLSDGAIAQFHYADQLTTLPLGLFGVAVGVVALPSLTEMAVKNQFKELHLALGQSIGLALYLSLPAAAGLAGIAEPLVKILFQRGAFDSTAAFGTALAVMGTAPCLPAIAIARPLLAACHAYGYVKLTAIAGLSSMLVTALSSIALPKILAGQGVELMGIGLAVSLGAWFYTMLLWLLLQKKQLTPPLEHLKSCIGPLLLSIVIYLICVLCRGLIAISPYIYIGVLVPLCMLGYLVLTHFMGCEHAIAVINSCKSRKRNN